MQVDKGGTGSQELEELKRIDGENKEIVLPFFILSCFTFFFHVNLLFAV